MSQINPPTFVRAGVTLGYTKMKVVDAKSGREIPCVIEADAEKGRVLRRDLDDNGNLRIVDDAFKTIEEDRAIRIKWTTDPEEPVPVLDEGAATGAEPA